MTGKIKSYLIGIRTFRAWIVNYLLNLFTLPRVGEEIGKLAGKFMSEADRFSTGIKGEAIETKEIFGILAKYIKKEKISRGERKQFKQQIISVLKGAGVIVPVMLIPLPFVSTLLLILVDHLLLSMNIHILPPSFYSKENKNLMTRESVEKDLQKSVGSY